MVVTMKACVDVGGTYSSVQNPVLYQSTQYPMVVRMKACAEESGAQSSAWNHLPWQGKGT